MPPPSLLPDDLLAWLAEALPGTPTRIGKSVRALSNSYVKSQTPADAALSPAQRLAAYGRYYLPVNYPKLHLPLAELALSEGADPLARERLRVLDLGCGPGTFLLSAMGALSRRADKPREIELVGVDLDGRALEFCREACEWFAATMLPGVSVRVLTLRAEIFAALPAEYRGRGFDLVIVGNALAEWARGAGADVAAASARLAGAVKLLRESGALVVIEPALKETSRFLLETRDALLASGAAHVYAPCLHEAPCPALAKPRDWCHERLDWALPRALEDIDRAAGLQKGSLAFSYLTLRREARSLADALAPAPAQWERARVVSDAMPEKGKQGCIACTERGRRVYYEALDRDATHGVVDALRALSRGHLAAFAPGTPAGERTRLNADQTPRACLSREGTGETETPEMGLSRK